MGTTGDYRAIISQDFQGDMDKTCIKWKMIWML